MKTQRGFTIIELIVVVAIIAVLAAIVLVNVTQYINKGKDAAAKGNLSTLMTDGAVYFDTNSNYNNWVTGAGTGASSYVNVYKALTSSNMGYTVTANCDVAACGATSTKWCAQVTLKSGNTFCVDSTGAKLDKSNGTCASGVCS